MKTALILGGASDIGSAIAGILSRNNWNLILAGRNKNYLQRIKSDIVIRTKTKVKLAYFDALDFESHAYFYRKLPVPPDLCICAFGYLGDQMKAEIDWAESSKIIDTNYRGAVSILNIVAADFANRGSGTLIGISSVSGDRGRQSNYIYGSAKAAFTTYLSGLRNRLFTHGVKVITIKPGFVNTRMTEGMSLPAHLTATPEKVAEVVYSAYSRRRNVIYVLGIWQLIMWMIRSIPEGTFKRLKL